MSRNSVNKFWKLFQPMSQLCAVRALKNFNQISNLLFFRCSSTNLSYSLSLKICYGIIRLAKQIHLFFSTHKPKLLNQIILPHLFPLRETFTLFFSSHRFLPFQKILIQVSASSIWTKKQRQSKRMTRKPLLFMYLHNQYILFKAVTASSLSILSFSTLLQRQIDR